MAFDVSKINNNSVNLAPSNSDNELKNLREGQILVGTITKTDSSKSSITLTDGTILQINSKDIHGTTGDTVKFSVEDTKGNYIVMKQIIEERAKKEKEVEKEGKSLQEDKYKYWVKGSVIPVTGETFANAKISNENTIELRKKSIEAINKIKKDITFAASNINKNVLSEFSSKGYSIDSLTVNVINEAIKNSSNNKSQPTDEEVENALIQFSETTGAREYEKLHEIALSLAKNGLNISGSNINSLKSLLSKAAEINENSIKSAINLLLKGQSPTIDNLYMALHSSGGDTELSSEEPTVEEMTPEIIKYLGKNQVKLTSNNIENAKILFANNLPVTNENIELMNSIGVLDNKPSELLDKAAKNLSKGINPGQININDVINNDSTNLHNNKIHNEDELLENYKKIINSLPKINDNVILSAINNNSAINLKNLIDIAEKGNNQQQLQVTEKNSSQLVTNRRRMEEVRLMLTVQSAAVMAKAGIQIDSYQLKDAVDKLKELENESFKTALNSTAGEASAKNVSNMADIFNKVRSLNLLGDKVITDINNKEIDFTVEEINFASERLKTDDSKKSYEDVQTKVNSKYGDSFNKIEDQIENLLNSIGIENNKENIKCAKTLIRTGSDVDIDSINSIKLINNKIINLTQKLHPIIAANMIKDQFNPLTSHVDDVNNYIDEYNKQNSVLPSQKFEESLYEMDKKNALSKDERNAVVGMYRMLHTIEKNNAAAVGFIVKNNMSLTLENLMEAGKYFDKTKGKKSSIDTVVDESFGDRDIINNTQSIRSQLNTALENAISHLETSGGSVIEAKNISNNSNLGFNSNTLNLINEGEILKDANSEQSLIKASNTQSTLLRFMDLINPNSLLDLYNENSDFTSLSIEEATDRLQNLSDIEDINIHEDLINKFISDIRNFETISPQMLSWMEHNGITNSIGNLKALKGLMNNRNYLSDTINDIADSTRSLEDKSVYNEIIDSLETPDLEKLKSGKSSNEIIEGIVDACNNSKKEIVSDGNIRIDILRNTSITENISKLSRNISEAENLFQIPIKLSNGISNLNIYVINEDAKGSNMNVLIQVKTSSLGNVQCYANINNDSIDLNINSDQSNGVDYLKSNIGIIEDYLNEIGVDNHNITFGYEEENNTLNTIINPKDHSLTRNNNSAFEITV